MSAVILYPFNVTDNEWENPLWDLFEVLLEGAWRRIMLAAIHLGLVLKDPNLIEVSRLLIGITAEGQGDVADIGASREEDIHVLEVAGITNRCILRQGVVGVRLNIVLGNGFMGVVADGLVTRLNGDVGLSITPVIHPNIDGITGVRLQVG